MPPLHELAEQRIDHLDCDLAIGRTDIECGAVERGRGKERPDVVRERVTLRRQTEDEIHSAVTILIMGRHDRVTTRLEVAKSCPDTSGMSLQGKIAHGIGVIKPALGVIVERDIDETFVVTQGGNRDKEVRSRRGCW